MDSISISLASRPAAVGLGLLSTSPIKRRRLLPLIRLPNRTAGTPSPSNLPSPRTADLLAAVLQMIRVPSSDGSMSSKRTSLLVSISPSISASASKAWKRVEAKASTT
jgi:hypothetical protein